MTSSLAPYFYRFTGLHSWLMGLIPFFVPAFLFQQGFDLIQISAFISVVGIGYLLILRLWDYYRWSWDRFISLSFALEITFVLSWFYLSVEAYWPILALIMGLYNGVFWTAQRLLFLEKTNFSNRGRGFGNVQIFVFILLKLGIIVGSYCLVNGSVLSLIYLSIVSALWGLYLLRNTPASEFIAKVNKAEILPIKKILCFRDRKASQTTFWLDGPFLFLESFFWSISLFIIAGGNLWHFGLLMVALSVLFSILFWIIKNLIDHISTLRNHPYVFGVLLYAASWFLRAYVPEIESQVWLGVTIIAIAFGTSYFRLVFNKRFFDQAHNSKAPHQYIYLKSYLSQLSIVIFFGLLGLQGSPIGFEAIYLTAGVLALGFLSYRRPKMDS